MAAVLILLVIALPLVLTSLAQAHVPHDVALPNWHRRPDVLVVLGFLGFIFARGWLFLRTRSIRVVKKRQLVFYFAGLISIAGALLSPIDALASSLLSMHMAQHLLLLMIAPLFILLANPLAACLWGLPLSIRRRPARLLAKGSLFRAVVRVLTLMPVTWSLYVINLWAWHHPALYQLALRDEWAHDLQHLLFFFAAVLFWWPIVNPAPRLHGLISYGYRIVYLIAATLQNTLLGMSISLPDRVLYPFYAVLPTLRDISPINDQALGGGIMWVSGHMYLIPILVLVHQMLTREEKAINGHPAKEFLSRVQD